MKYFIRKYFFEIVLVGIVIYLGFVNFPHGNYLLGWDSLQTDLNPLLGLKRAVFAGWQEYQGLGLTSGMAHATDMVRALTVVLLSFVLPQSLVRYVFHLLMLLLGSIGAYVLFREFSGQNKRIFSFLGALLYMLNFGVMQMFFVPYEAFSIFYAVLPWELWIFLHIILNKEKVSKKNLLLFITINILATPQAYVQTLFLVYCAILSCASLGAVLIYRKKNIITRSLLLVLIIAVVNLFWILPQVYFLRSSGSIVEASKINQLATDTVYYQNLEKGTINNLVFFRGFYYDLFSKDSSLLFLPWKIHFQYPLILYINIGIFIFALLGLVSKKKSSLLFLALLLLTIFPLLNNTPLFSEVNIFLRKNMFINQIFRSPFTKFIIPYSLLFSFFFVNGVIKVFSIMKRPIMLYFFFLLVACGIIFQAIPAFHGYLFAPEMKVSIPNDYQKSIEFFRSQDKNKRIALLPDYTFWGWFLTRWGYDGSGFLWYGIEQPILSRTFDVWSEKNEGYFWEIKYAIESKNAPLFQSVLDKYNVSYLIVDKTLLPVSSSTKGMQYKKIDEIVQKLPAITPRLTGSNIEIYENNNQKDVVQIVSNPPYIDPVIKKTDVDNAYFDLGIYISNPNTAIAKGAILYPFLDLTSQVHSRGNPNWSLSETENEFQLVSSIPMNYSKYDFIVPKDTFEYTWLTESGKLATKSGQIDLRINNDGKVLINIPKILLNSYKPDDYFIEKCNENKKGYTNVQKLDTLNVSTYNGASLCFNVINNLLDQSNSYVASITIDYIKGRQLLFYILDQTNKESVLEDRLNTQSSLYIIPPRDVNSIGYNMSFQSNSYEGLASQSILKNLSLYVFPFDIVKNITIVPKNIEGIIGKSHSVSVEFKKNSYYLYEVNNLIVPLNSPQTLVLSQAFDQGWKAYELKAQSSKLNWMQTNFPFFFGTEIKEHVLVNNWENGWITDSSRIVIVFWPQYLEYLGFALLFLTFGGIVLWKEKKKHDASHLDSSPPKVGQNDAKN